VLDAYDSVFQPLIPKLRKDRSGFPRTIVYSKLKWCSYGYEETVRPTENGERDHDIERCVAQFHSPCTPEVRIILSPKYIRPKKCMLVSGYLIL
jgi:hypothetical protein